MAPGGDAVGRRADGLIVFVPGGAPGDRALVAVETLKKGHARGRLLQLLSPGGVRVDPECALAVPEACGGCPLMAVNRQAQLLAKADWVRRALRPSRLGTDVEVAPIAAPPPPLAYRLRARLVVRGGRLGFSGARSHRGVAIARCAVLVPALDRVLFTHGPRLVPLLGEGTTVRGLVGQHEGREAVQLGVELAEGASRRALHEALSSLVRDGVLAGAILQDARRREVLGAEVLMLGADSEFGPFFGAADGFAQPSAAGHTLLPRLVHEALVEVGAGRVLELFSGSGNLTRAIVRAASQVVCVEGDGGAVRRARQLFAEDPAVSLVAQPAEQALRELGREGARFDALVLDPPRIGALVEVPLFQRLEARRIVYVSCDPMTLGRDLAALSTRGYVIRRVQPIDLMPHTAHVECVAIADRAT
jgi:23S rRNA (uracil1939-C5)-methyltransferase